METAQNFRSNLVSKTGKKKSESAQQKTFNRLIKKVKELQGQQEKIVRELDEALQFYHTAIHPKKLALAQHLTERLHLIYDFYKTGQGLSKNEWKQLRTWLTEEVRLACEAYDHSEVPVTIKEMFKVFNGVEYDESQEQEAEEVKEIIQKTFKNFFGAEIDFSDLDINSSPEDFQKALFAKLGKAGIDFQEERAHQAPKTKKQLAKEAKKQAVEELQNKTLQSMYKQLVRTLHPDLERDAEKRALKEEFMKKLTVAYENNDLYSLLKIEMEWMNHTVDTMKTHHDDDIKIYNAILKDQVKELEAANGMLFMHPRYAPLQEYYQFGFSDMLVMQQRSEVLAEVLQRTQTMVARLKTSEAAAVIRELVQIRNMKGKRVPCSCGSC